MAIGLVSSLPTVAARATGAPGTLRWQTTADPYASGAFDFDTVQQVMNPRIGFVVLSLALVAMVAFNLAAWQKLKRVHLHANRSGRRRTPKG